MGNKTVDISEEDMMGDAPHSSSASLNNHLIDNPDRETLEAKLTELEAQSLRDKLLLEEQLKQANEKFLRTMADFENFRKQSEKREQDARKYAVMGLLENLVPVLDSFEQGLNIDIQSANPEDIHQGLMLTAQIFLKVLEKFGVSMIDPAINETTFNPSLHEVMLAQEKTEVAPNTIIGVMQKGYQLHDRLLRPARVIVSKTSP